jgi:type IV pilus assembly protein PilV
MRLNKTGVGCGPTALQHGISLVEILVTVVIISVGLLGVASLHLTSLRAGNGAHTRSQATALATDIIDRMRANREAALNKEYLITMGTKAPITPTGLVDTDKKQWLDALQQALPNGQGSVVETLIATRRAFQVTIQWDERVTDDNLTPPNSFVTTVEL